MSVKKILFSVIDFLNFKRGFREALFAVSVNFHSTFLDMFVRSWSKEATLTFFRSHHSDKNQNFD